MTTFIDIAPIDDKIAYINPESVEFVRSYTPEAREFNKREQFKFHLRSFRNLHASRLKGTRVDAQVFRDSRRNLMSVASVLGGPFLVNARNEINRSVLEYNDYLTKVANVSRRTK